MGSAAEGGRPSPRNLNWAVPVPQRSRCPPQCLFPSRCSRLTNTSAATASSPSHSGRAGDLLAAGKQRFPARRFPARRRPRSHPRPRRPAAAPCLPRARRSLLRAVYRGSPERKAEGRGRTHSPASGKASPYLPAGPCHGRQRPAAHWPAQTGSETRSYRHGEGPDRGNATPRARCRRPARLSRPHALPRALSADAGPRGQGWGAPGAPPTRPSLGSRAALGCTELRWAGLCTPARSASAPFCFTSLQRLAGAFLRCVHFLWEGLFI